MATANAQWTVLPHEPTRRLAENLWWVSGSLPSIPLRRCMTVVKLSDGRLLIYSAIALEANAQRELESWGRPSLLIVPNREHRLDAPAYRERYPELKVFGPAKDRKRIEQVVPLDGVLEEFPADADAWFEPLAGIGDTESVMFVRSADGVSLVFNDAVFNITRKLPFFSRLVVTILGSAPGPRVSRLFKLLFVKDKRAFRERLEQLAQTPNLVRVIVAHEELIEGHAACVAALRKAATFL